MHTSSMVLLDLLYDSFNYISLLMEKSIQYKNIRIAMVMIIKVQIDKRE